MEYDMVFEGGGAKGMAFVGALQELEVLGHTPGRLLGTSAGSIMATLLAAGYGSREMGDALCETQEDGEPVFLGFLEVPPKMTKDEMKQSVIREVLRSANMKFVPDIVEERLDDEIADLISHSSITARLCSFMEYGGIFAAESFLRWMEAKLNAGVYSLDRGNFGKGKRRAFGNMTLQNFYEATGTELSLVASDTVAGRILVLNHHTAPDCPVKYAVRMSMSIPLVWHEVIWKLDWGNYMGRDISGHTIVDGGLLSNFPIELFLSGQEHITKIMGIKKDPTTSLLGFLIDEDGAVPDAPPPEKEPSHFNFGSFKPIQRVVNLINTMTQAHDKEVIEAHANYVIRLPAHGYGTVEFGMKEERRNALVAAGRKSTQDYFIRMASAATELPMPEFAPVAGTADRIATHILYP